MSNKNVIINYNTEYFRGSMNALTNKNK